MRSYCMDTITFDSLLSEGVLEWAIWGQCREIKAYIPSTLLHHGWLLVLEELRSGKKMLFPGPFFSSQRTQKNDTVFNRGIFS